MSFQQNFKEMTHTHVSVSATKNLNWFLDTSRKMQIKLITVSIQPEKFRNKNLREKFNYVAKMTQKLNLMLESPMNMAHRQLTAASMCIGLTIAVSAPAESEGIQLPEFMKVIKWMKQKCMSQPDNRLF